MNDDQVHTRIAIILMVALCVFGVWALGTPPPSQTPVAAADFEPIPLLPAAPTLAPLATSVPTPVPVPVVAGSLGNYTYDLNAGTFNIQEADNVRWALLRRTVAGTRLWSKPDDENPNGLVDWGRLRTLTGSGALTIPTETPWSFNAQFRAGVGYRQASGILAGGHCSLASALKAAADNAGLRTEFDKKHSLVIPGFAAETSVSILWGGPEHDLRVYNDTGADLRFAWRIVGDNLTIDVVPAPPSPAYKTREWVRVSHYDPALGPPNCSAWDEEKEICTSNMASGQDWKPYRNTNSAVACPPEWDFGTTVRFPDFDLTYTCLDRGGRIVYYGTGVAEMAWIDLLRPEALIAYGATALVELTFP